MAKTKLKKPEAGKRILTRENQSRENPRRITGDELTKLKESLERFGDLGGIVLNRTTGNLVGGHQRITSFNESNIEATITEELKKPDRTGTVAYGHIELFGTRYSYREVAWTKSQERIANIAANKLGGDFDDQLLADALKRIKEDPEANGEFEQTGFTDSDLTRLLGELSRTPGHGRREPRQSDDDYSLFELVMWHENKKRFVELLDRIRETEGVKTVEEAIMHIVDEYEKG
jgi:hypothetical protein